VGGKDVSAVAETPEEGERDGEDEGADEQHAGRGQTGIVLWRADREHRNGLSQTSPTPPRGGLRLQGSYALVSTGLWPCIASLPLDHLSIRPADRTDSHVQRIANRLLDKSQEAGRQDADSGCQSLFVHRPNLLRKRL